MKILSMFAPKLLAGAIALAAVAMTSQVMADSVPQVITVVRVHGEARYTTDNRTWNALKKGDVLKPGCVIQTAPKAVVDIQLGERDAAVAPAGYNPTSPLYAPEQQKANIVRIFENSALAVDKLILEKNTGTGEELSETQLDLRAGTIFGNVKKLSATSKYEVKIPNGVAGIRGTTYMISSSGVVSVLTGSVVVAIVGSDGTVITRVVTAHQSYDPTTNTITNLTPDQVAILQKIYIELGGPPSTPPSGPVPNTPILYVSPN
jgi:hypothetical protein